ncbi:unnamed protein product [Bursaphelenchus okinawaensis]|uniref:Uncharacterized protein n=1 Tax=Bursaphelenchus okinawaensis TaxID=465554 RepID=A0A811L5V7_9BILA|nr:unnamed protein product [Bursaphelenchus okinawaensis]CAG9118309.1 unnamed protein product [Bursaphelenchus okinawaensis]
MTRIAIKSTIKKIQKKERRARKNHRRAQSTHPTERDVVVRPQVEEADDVEVKHIGVQVDHAGFEAEHVEANHFKIVVDEADLEVDVEGKDLDVEVEPMELKLEECPVLPTAEAAAKASVHLASSVFPTNTEASAEAASVHLASSIFPTKTQPNRSAEASAEVLSLHLASSVFPTTSGTSKKPASEEAASVHLATSVFPTGGSVEPVTVLPSTSGTLAEAASVHLASSVFPTESAESTESSELKKTVEELIHDLKALTTMKKLVNNKSKSVELIKSRAVAKRISASTEHFKPETPLNLLGQLSLSIQRNKVVLDQLMRSKEASKEEADLETCYCNLTSILHPNPNRSCVGMDEVSKRVHLSESIRHRSCCFTTSSVVTTDATDQGSHFNLPSMVSDSAICSNSSLTRVTTDETSGACPVLKRHENIGNQGLRCVALDCDNVAQLMHQLGATGSISDYVRRLEEIVGDYLLLVRKVYYPFSVRK